MYSDATIKDMTKSQITLALACIFWYFMESTYVLGVKNITHGISRYMRSLGFPDPSNTGILFAVGIPVDIPDKSISISFYFEANYGLPSEWNLSNLPEENYFVKRSLSRRLVYKVFVSKMKSLGYPGLDCLLRTICESTKYPWSENGILGDILQLIFTPSMSESENLPNEIIEAEKEQYCDQRYQKCTINPLDLISHFVHAN